MYLTHNEIETANLSQQDLEHIKFNLGNYFKDIREFTEKEIKDLYFVDSIIKSINIENIIKVRHKYYNISTDETYSVVEIYLNNEVNFGSDNVKATGFVLYLSNKLSCNKLEFGIHKLNFKGIKVFYEFVEHKTIYLEIFNRLSTYLHQMKPVLKHTSLEYWENRKKQAQYELDTVNNMIEQCKKEINNLKEE